MRARVVLLLLFVPLLELVLLIEVGRTVGTWPALAWVVGTVLLGVVLAKAQGFGLWRRLREDALYGRMPGDGIVDALLVFLGAALLIIPGLVTDMAGALLLIPPSRAHLKAWLRSKLRRWVEDGSLCILLR